MMKRMTSWFCDVCGCRSDILEDKCPNGCIGPSFPVIDLIKKEPFRSIPNVNINDDMVRLTLDMSKRDWQRLQSMITRLDTKQESQ
jgi:hypothetical protein